MNHLGINQFIDSQKNKNIPGIVIPVMPAEPGAAAVLAGEAVKAGADLIEYRADSLYRNCGVSESMGAFRAVCAAAGKVPVLYTLRTKAQGGCADTDGPAYEAAVREAVLLGCADYVDIEYSQPSAGSLLEYARGHGMKVILSEHSFSGTPSSADLTEIFVNMEKMGADLAKCACMPLCVRDADRMLAVSARASRMLKIPIAAISMGETGRDSRLSGEIYGSSITFGCLPGEMSAPGQMEAGKLRRELERVHALRQSGEFIFLSGFMGAGKTRTAGHLSDVTGLPVLEMDELIEEHEGRKVSEIFEQEGEDYFRSLETHFLSGLYGKAPAVVSCGGGAVLKEENRALMHALGKTVLLRVRPDTVLERLASQADSRPNIRNRMTEEGIASLMKQREDAYADAADFQVSTDGRTTGEISLEILGLLERNASG